MIYQLWVEYVICTPLVKVKKTVAQYLVLRLKKTSYKGVVRIHVQSFRPLGELLTAEASVKNHIMSGKVSDKINM